MRLGRFALPSRPLDSDLNSVQLEYGSASTQRTALHSTRGHRGTSQLAREAHRSNLTLLRRLDFDQFSNFCVFKVQRNYGDTKTESVIVFEIRQRAVARWKK